MPNRKYVYELTDVLLSEVEDTDPFRIARHLDIDVIILENNDYKKSPKAFIKNVNENLYIFIQSTQDLLQQDYLLLHELGHSVLHRDFSSTLFFSNFNNKIEAEANSFAIRVLMKKYSCSRETIVQSLNAEYGYFITE